jgi:hypothetical protein
MANIDRVNAYLAQEGYDINARVADYRDPKAYNAPKAAPTSSGFFNNVGASLSKIPGAALNAGVGVAEGFGKGVGAWGHNLVGSVKIMEAGSQLNQQVAQAKKLQEKFKAGKISAKEFSIANQRILEINKQTVDKQNKLRKDQLSGTDLAKATGETALNVGSLLLSGGLGKQAVEKLAAKEGIAGVAGKAGQFGLRTLGSDTSANAGTALLKSQIVAKPSIQTLPQIAKDVSTGNYGGAAVNTALMATGGLEGGPLKAAGAIVNKVGSGVSRLTYSTHGVFDAVKLKGGKSPIELLDMAKKELDPKRYKQIEGRLKVAQDLINQKGLTPEEAAKQLGKYQPAGKKFADMTLLDFAKVLDRNVANKSIAQKAILKAGMKLPEGVVPVAASVEPEIKKVIMDRLGSASNVKAELASLKKDGVLVNKNLRGRIEDMVNSSKSGSELRTKIAREITATKPLEGFEKIKLPNGQFIGAAKGAEVVHKASEVQDLIRGHKALFGSVGNTLRKIGLSTEESSPQAMRNAFGKVVKSFEGSVDEAGLSLPGTDVLAGLNKLARDGGEVTDIRQLKWKEVAKAFNGKLDNAESKEVLKLYKESFKELGYAERGVAGKVMDFNLRNNPLAAPYSRIQGKFRYDKNPFFRRQEDIETKVGTGILTGAIAKPGEDYSKIRAALHNEGFFKGAGFGGQSAEDFGGITARLSLKQEDNLAAGFKALGVEDSAGLKKFMANPDNAGMVQDLKAVVQYPDKGFTSSNFMKALNLAVFPTRYNLKVTSLAVKALSKQSGAAQLQVLKGLNDFNKWQKTPDGIKWNSQNSELLGIIRYFTPVGSVESVLRILGGDIQTIRDLGTVGGLPFGVISGVLQGQGAIKLDSPYLDPKTGEVVPEKIPKDTKARMEQALVDILGTMFTYPGRQIGITSKKQLTQGVVGNVPYLKGGKYESVTRKDLTPEQKRTQAALRAGRSSSAPELPGNTVRRVDLASNKPVSFSPIYKRTSAKKGKTRAIPVGRF